MTNMKSVTELPVADSAEGLNLIVNDHGAAKQIPAGEVGAQADFNETNENSPAFIKNKPKVAQPDWFQNDETAPDYIKNRTHYKEVKTVNEPLNITWDGNTDGLVSVGGVFWKISDLVLTDEQIKSVTFSFSDGSTVPVLAVWEEMMVTEDVAVFEAFAFCRKDGTTHNALIFPEAGIYVFGIGETYISGVTSTEPVEQTKTIVKTIDPKFLPEHLRFGDVVSSVLTWDGNKDGLIYVDLYGDGDWPYYHVSDEVVTLDVLKNGFYHTGVWDDGEGNYQVSADEVCAVGSNSEIVFDEDMNVFFVTVDNAEYDGVIFPKAGVYLYADDGYRVSSVTVPRCDKFEGKIYKPIDSKYLPNSINPAILYVDNEYAYLDQNKEHKASMQDIDKMIFDGRIITIFPDNGNYYQTVMVSVSGEYYEIFYIGFHGAGANEMHMNCVRTKEYTGGGGVPV